MSCRRRTWTRWARPWTSLLGAGGGARAGHRAPATGIWHGTPVCARTSHPHVPANPRCPSPAHPRGTLCAPLHAQAKNDKSLMGLNVHSASDEYLEFKVYYRGTRLKKVGAAAGRALARWGRSVVGLLCSAV
mgnify:CR=1 FL=1